MRSRKEKGSTTTPRHAVVIIAVMLFFSGFVFAAFDREFFFGQFEKNRTYDTLKNADAVLDNLLGYFAFGELDTGSYSEQEILHLKDVRALLWLLFWIFAVSLGASAVVLVRTLLRKDRIVCLEKVLFWSGTIAGVSLAVLAIGGLWFDRAFIMFHKVVFRNSYWQLGAKDTLIVMFPRQFWIKISQKALLTSFAYSLYALLLSLTLRLYRQCRSRGSAPKA